MEKVAIQIDARWLRRVKSPLFWVVGGLQGVSVTFAPLFLLWAATGNFQITGRVFILSACFLSILLVGWFYLLLGHEVIRELAKQNRAGNS
jgi:hypothetical protein